MKLLENMQTVLPEHVHTYLRQLAIVHYGSLQSVYEDMVQKFLHAKPWDASPALAWREAPMRDGAGCTVANISLTIDLAQRLDETLKEINTLHHRQCGQYGLTKKTFLYTAVFWWTTYIYPNQKTER